MPKDLKKRLPGQELVRLYKTEGHSLGDIGKMYGVSRTAIMKYCNILGVARRTKGEARLLAQKRGKVGNQRYCTINEAFFGSWSPEMAYVLGLLITDGCLSRSKNGSYRISLCLNDRSLLEKVARAIGSNHTIANSKHQRGLHVFIFGRKKIAQDLMRLGMKPRKSLDIGFPDVPDGYLRDFIRGAFDGDGSVYYSKAKKLKLTTSFTSGSRAFVYGLEKALQGLGMPQQKIYESHYKNTYYTIRYSHKNSIILFKILYGNMQNDLYLRRKYDKFKAVIDHEKSIRRVQRAT